MEKHKELFDQLYRDNYVKVYRLAFWLTHNFSDAEDITQEAFVRAFRSYHTFREESSFYTWIYRITVNVANDYMKQRKKLPIYEIAEGLGCSVEDLADPHPDNSPETKLMVNEVMRVCMAAFTECLPVNQRKVFFLAVGLGLPYKIVAEILDCSVSSVKTTLHRANNRLVGYMESQCHLIKKSNPCRCEQWVKRGLAQGWITKEAVTNPQPRITIPDKVKLYLRDLRDIYKNVYLGDKDEVLAEFFKEGFVKRRWATFS
jgi:RNA polymerase sigma-70 factor (ECF subfamily)